MLAQVVFITYTPLYRWYMKHIHHLQNDRFFPSFLSEMLPDPPGLWSITWEVPERVSLMKLCHSQEERWVSNFSYLYVLETPCYSSLFPVSSLCQRRLVACILYESWLLGVFHVYTTLILSSSEVCSAYICGIHCVTMIYILHVH